MTMTRYEGEKLDRLIRDMERVGKAENGARAAELFSDFQVQLAAKYSYDQDSVGTDAWKDAEEAAKKANREVIARCRERGIPPEFSPGLSVSWRSRGENAVKERRQELEKVAKAEIDAYLKRANSNVSHVAAKVRVDLTAGLIETDAAKKFLAGMPKAAELMPKLSLGKVEDALKQRRIGAGYGYEYAMDDAVKKYIASLDDDPGKVEP